MKFIPNKGPETENDKVFSRYVCLKCRKTFLQKKLFCDVCRGPFVIKIKTIIK